MRCEEALVTIYHNPALGTSQKTAALIRDAGVKRTVIEYLKTPPDHPTLIDLPAQGVASAAALAGEQKGPFTKESSTSRADRCAG